MIIIAHIFVTDKCNLSCPYCFANKNIQKKQFKEISNEELLNILNWLKQTKSLPSLGLIGGEPTLHSRFPEIVKIIEEQLPDVPLHIFSNGIFEQNYFDIFTKHTSLLNINSSVILNYKTKILQHNLKEFYDRKLLNNQVKIGINLYLDIPNTDFIFDIMNEYKINTVRFAYAAPCKQYQTEIVNKEAYYKTGKQIFLNFVEQAKNNHKTINVDCNHIPICYFTKEEKQLIKEVCSNYELYCSFYCDNPALDIMPDLTAISCFGINQPIDLKQFNNLTEVYQYLRQEQIKPLSLKNQTGKCKECMQFECLKCQGGCLSFVS